MLKHQTYKNLFDDFSKDKMEKLKKTYLRVPVIYTLRTCRYYEEIIYLSDLIIYYGQKKKKQCEG